MARKLKSDKVLFLATLLLVCASAVMVSSASKSIGSKQLMWVAVGVVVLAGAMRFDYERYKQPPILWTMLGLAGAGLVVVLWGPEVGGARRWLGLGGFGVQPSELAKLAIVVFTAAMLEQRMARINDVKYSMAPIALVVGPAVLLILREPDYGTSLAIVATVALMVFAAGLAWRYLAWAALGLVPAAIALLVAAQYRRERLLAFLDPWKDPQIAVGTGGTFGRGLGGGIQKLHYLPAPHNDFIYAVIGEELGLIGTTVILACFVVLIWRGLRIAARAQDPFASLLATGLTAMIGVQAMVNMSVVLGLLPTKGIPLPLVSAGGSSLLISMLVIGILLNLSQRAVPSA